MPPPKSRAAPDDARSESSSSKDRLVSQPAANVNGKNRRAIGHPNTTIPRELPSTIPSMTAPIPVSTATGSNMTDNTGGSMSGGGIQWSTLDADILNHYRHAYRLNTPASVGNPFNQYILASSSIGRMSPTMVRKKEQRRQSKEQLANACRKHFNGLGIQENEAVVDFLYKVKFQDKNFRLRFTPQRLRRPEPTSSGPSNLQ